MRRWRGLPGEVRALVGVAFIGAALLSVVKPREKSRPWITVQPMVAPNSGVTLTTWESISPEEIVFATAVPQSAPIRFVAAASSTAWPGLSTLVATTVAIELAVS